MSDLPGAGGYENSADTSGTPDGTRPASPKVGVRCLRASFLDAAVNVILTFIPLRVLDYGCWEINRNIMGLNLAKAETSTVEAYRLPPRART